MPRHLFGHVPCLWKVHSHWALLDWGKRYSDAHGIDTVGDPVAVVLIDWDKSLWIAQTWCLGHHLHARKKWNYD
jgi:hypothetical protein